MTTCSVFQKAILSLFLLAAGAFASVPAEAAATEITEHPYWRITRYTNSDEITEFRVEHRDTRGSLPGSWYPVFFARDLDSDEFPDAWFYRDKQGSLIGKDIPANERDGWDVILKLVKRSAYLNDKSRFEVDGAFNKIAETLTFGMSYYHGVRRSLLEQELDLWSLQIQAMRMLRENPDDPKVLILMGMVQRGFADMIERIESTTLRNSFLSVTADVGLYYVGAYLAKGAMKAFQVIVSNAAVRIFGTSATAASKAVYTAYVESFKLSMQGVFSRIEASTGGRISLRTAEHAILELESRALARLTVQQQVKTLMKGAFTREKFKKTLSHTLIQAVKAPVTVARASLKRVKYLAIAQGLQIGAEIVTRHEELFSDEPLIVQKSRKEFLHNYLFMSNETFWTTGIASSIKNPLAGFITCGFFSLANSTFMNYVFKQSSDPIRTVFDESWEVAIGNTQTQIDTRSLAYFESLAAKGGAAKTGNPKLVLIGYAIAIIDQGAGYLGYSYLSEKIENNHDAIKAELRRRKIIVKVAPVFEDQSVHALD